MWNERYNNPEFQYGVKPNDFIKQQLDQLPIGRILVPGAGEGRDAVYAAKLGWEVYAFDFSERAQEKAIKLAQTEKVQLYFTCEDATKVNYPLASFDAIVLTFFHLPPEIRISFHQKCIKWLKPGGKIILEGFNKNQLGKSSGGPKDINWLFDCTTLENDFKDLEIVQLIEKQRILDEGPLHQGLAEVVQMVGEKL
jgi:SAM-dependent methyltransferase